MRALAEALEMNSSLTALCIGVCVHRAVKESVAYALVQGNGVSDAGAGALAEVLQRNGTLRLLSLDVRWHCRDKRRGTRTDLRLG